MKPCDPAVLYRIHASNHRLHVALSVIRLFGRDIPRMSEVYDALQQRHRMRHATITAEERRELDRRYLLQHAPDLLHTIK